MTCCVALVPDHTTCFVLGPLCSLWTLIYLGCNGLEAAEDAVGSYLSWDPEPPS